MCQIFYIVRTVKVQYFQKMIIVDGSVNKINIGVTQAVT